MPTSIKLRQLTSAKGLTPAELELLAYNNWIIENALNSVGAVSPVPSSSPPPPTIPIRHDQLLELTDDDHLQYLLLAGRGTQNIVGPLTLNGKPVLTEAFPVGAVFIGVVSTNPNTLLGYGTWSAFGAGRVLVGLDSGDTDFDVVEETGGSKTHTLITSEIPSHTHTQDSHNHTQNAHTHIVGTDVNPIINGAFGANEFAGNGGSAVSMETTATNQAATATNQNTGGGGAHKNVQPYIVVYMWKRTA